MNQDHLQQQPAADKYIIGGPSEFAEDLSNPTPGWKADLGSDGNTKRNEIGMPEMRKDTFGTPEKAPGVSPSRQASVAEVHAKADVATKIARLMLSKSASEAVIEDQALSLMNLPLANLQDTLTRLAQDQDDEDEDEDEQDEDQGQQQKQARAKRAQQDDDDGDDDQQKQAGEIPPQFLENVKKKQDEAKKDDDKEDKKASSRKRAQQDDEDEGQQQQKSARAKKAQQQDDGDDDQQKQAGEIPPQFLENVKKKQDEAKKDDDKDGDKKASKRKAQQDDEDEGQQQQKSARSKSAQQDEQDEDEGQQKQAQQDEGETAEEKQVGKEAYALIKQAASDLLALPATSRAATFKVLLPSLARTAAYGAQQQGQQIALDQVTSQVQQLVQQAMQQQQQQAQQQQQPQTMADQQLVDQMLQEPDPLGEDTIQLDAPDMDMGLGVYASEDDQALQAIFASDPEVQRALEAQNLEGGRMPTASQVHQTRTASTRSVGTRPSSGVSHLGGASSGGGSSSSDEINKLSNMWASAPDVSSVFR